MTFQKIDLTKITRSQHMMCSVYIRPNVYDAEVEWLRFGSCNLDKRADGSWYLSAKFKNAVGEDHKSIEAICLLLIGVELNFCWNGTMFLNAFVGSDPLQDMTRLYMGDLSKDAEENKIEIEGESFSVLPYRAFMKQNKPEILTTMAGRKVSIKIYPKEEK